MHEVELASGIHNGLTLYSATCTSCGLVTRAQSSKTLARVIAEMHAYDPYKELSDVEAEAYAIKLMRKFTS